MEIPYIVEARKDTGLFNSKIAIWLFLASEVMLFGGLFSAYIFLRLGADFPWPERALPILPGLVNTAILIFSSVTVVFAWAELKLRNWRKFQIYMSITILCAIAFMCIKLPGEYGSKFAHQAIRTNDFGVVEGHILKKKTHHGEEKHVDSVGNYLKVATDKIKTYKVAGKDELETVEGLLLGAKVTRVYEPYYTTILKQAEDQKFKTYLYLGENKDAFIQIGEKRYDSTTPLTIETLAEFKEFFVEARTNNNTHNRLLLNAAWKQFRKERKEGLHPAYEGARDAKAVVAVKEIHKKLIAENIAKYINVEENFTDVNQIVLPDFVNFILEGHGYMKFVPAKGTFGGGTSLIANGDKTTILHRDKTTVIGKKAQSGIEIAIDQIDVSHFVMKWERDDKHNKLPLSAFLGSVNAETGVYTPPTQSVSLFSKDLEIDYYKDAKEVKHLNERNSKGATINNIWATHMKWLHYRTLELAKKESFGKKLEPTEFEKYVVTWQHMVGYGKVGYKMESQADYDAFKKVYPQWHASWFGPNHYKPEVETHFPYAFFPREHIRLESNLTPKWNNYYAIYFTITGLHGLHVIGGALVLAYYLFFGRKMYESNPEWLANRVEVGGLFWHFVDLVWIFAFPIFYLM